MSTTPEHCPRCSSARVVTRHLGGGNLPVAFGLSELRLPFSRTGGSIVLRPRDETGLPRGVEQSA